MNPNNRIFRHKDFYGDDSIVDKLTEEPDYNGIRVYDRTPWNSNDPKKDDYTQFHAKR
jgi:hypothetical protein